MKESRFSVIIPARNAAQTLPACLEALAQAVCQPSEVIVIDDDSTDATAEIARQHGCIVHSIPRSGCMKARFEGARSASHELLVFLDSDILVKPTVFSRILSLFQDPALSAVTGLLSRESRIPGFFTRFKNEYMNHIFRQRAGRTDFLYGALFAVRKKDMVYFEPLSEPFTFTPVSDSELGLRLADEGKLLLLDAGLEVEHLKHYSFLSLLRNDFIVPFMFMRLLLSRFQESSWASERRFSHASLSQVAAVFSSALLWGAASVFVLTGEKAFVWLAAAAALGFYGYWLPFLIKARSAGAVFVLKSFLFLPADAFVMFAGMVSGFFYSLAKAKRLAPERAAV